MPRSRARHAHNRPARRPRLRHLLSSAELDSLSDKFHLIYYDQRGRGRSADYVKPEDVSLESEIADLDEVREHFHLDKVVLLGHSWGTVLALEYELRHPERVSRLVPMDPTPASAADINRFRKERVEKWPVLMEGRPSSFPCRSIV